MIDRLRSMGRGPLYAGLVAAAVLIAAGCGSQAIVVQESDPNYRGAELFTERCSGCHTLSAAGTEGSKPKREVNSKDRTDGPDLDQRKVSYEDTLTAIRGGGYSGAVMPGNIVVGEDAEAVAQFVAEYSGKKQ